MNDPVIDKYQNSYRYTEDVWSQTYEPNPYKKFPDRFHDQKTYWKLVGDELGVSAKLYKRMINQLIYKVFVARFDNDIMKHFCFNPKGKPQQIQPYALRQLNNCYDYIVQAKKDGNWNITPFIYNLEEDPKFLKEHFGKGLWKKFCKNSFSRNQLICKTSRDQAVEGFKLMNEIPSSLLKWRVGANLTIMELQWCKQHMKGLWTDRRAIHNACQLVADTHRMAMQLNENFNLNWDRERMQREHNRFVELQNERWRAGVALRFQYVETIGDFSWIENIKAHKLDCFEYEGYTYELLDTVDKIKEEGADMHHCVGTYAPRSSRGEYAVYSVKKDGKKYSTLGIDRGKSVTVQNEKVPVIYSFNQHYKACNQVIDDVDCTEGAKILIKQLNKFSKGEK